MKTISVVGTRPNFMKIAPVLRAIDRHNSTSKGELIEHILVHTGQHYDYEMSQVFFEDLKLPEPDIHMGIGSGTHAEQTGRVMIECEKVLLREKPDLVIVMGDVNSTLAGALAAAKLLIPVAHIEAGPRTFDKSVPEEINRALTDHISTLLFAPTPTSVENLKREGIQQGVYLTGDVMLDSFLYFSAIAEKNSTVLNRLGLKTGEYLLATVHRVRNTDFEENLKNIVEAFLNIGDTVVFPIHPRTEKYLKSYGLYEKLKKSPNIKLIDPVGYLDSIMLIKNAGKVLTDSGGLQREACFSGVPCITLDEVTCWPETVESGWNVLVGSDKDKIVQAVKGFAPKGKRSDLFGDGQAAEKIVEIVQKLK
jgi:UDP-N-acetylglucosamine 2-epimerase